MSTDEIYGSAPIERHPMVEEGLPIAPVVLPVLPAALPVFPIPRSGINGKPDSDAMIGALARNLSSDPTVAKFNIAVDNTTGAVDANATSVLGEVATISNPAPGVVKLTIVTPTTPEVRDTAISALRKPLTQTETAKILGIGQSTVSRVENPPE